MLQFTRVFVCSARGMVQLGECALGHLGSQIKGPPFWLISHKALKGPPQFPSSALCSELPRAHRPLWFCPQAAACGSPSAGRGRQALFSEPLQLQSLVRKPYPLATVPTFAGVRSLFVRMFPRNSRISSSKLDRSAV